MTDVPDEVLHVADSVDEFVERTRLKQIHEARKAAADAIEGAALRKTQLRRDGVRKDEARELARETARSGVERYVLEVEARYKRTEAGRKLWHDAELGTISVHDPLTWEDEPDEVTQITVHPAAGIELRNGDRVAVVGVRAFVDGFHAASVEAEAKVPTATSANPNAAVSETLTAALTPPVRISREAFRATNALIAESDVGVKIEGEASGAENGYRDLLEDADDDAGAGGGQP